MISPDFLWELKRATEQKWNHESIDPTVSGFQFQRGTRWNPGLSNLEILEYENSLGMRFPHDLTFAARSLRRRSATGPRLLLLTGVIAQ